MRELLQKDKVTIIYYHNPNPSVFESHIQVLEHCYNIIPLSQFVMAQKDLSDKLPKKSLIITIDDGNYQNYDLFEIIKKYNIPVTIFLCSGLVDTSRHFWFRTGISTQEREMIKHYSDRQRLLFLSKYAFNERKEYETRHALSKQEIEEMMQIVDFQSHTIFHPILTKCTDQRSYEEIAGSKIELERKYNLNIYAIAYPNGNYSDREVKIAAKCGYECGLTTDAGYNDAQKIDPYRLKRISISDTASVSELIVRTCGLWATLKSLFKHLCDLSEALNAK
jgi:peptidoglycan/xylan/chitin deacetylase (PgdA/CDA1 family)